MFVVLRRGAPSTSVIVGSVSIRLAKWLAPANRESRAPTITTDLFRSLLRVRSA